MAKLTSKARNSLKSSEFVFPEQRKFPVEDRSHAVNALARASQSGVESIKAKVKEKVYKKYPDLREGSD
jgi:hypothetical protein